MPRTRKLSSKLLIATAILTAIVIGGIISLKVWYEHNLAPVSSSTTTVYFTVEPGSSSHVIAENLKQSHLIRNVSVFETYLTANNLRGKLQAGTYSLSPSLGVRKIVTKMTHGEIATDLLTILPGKRLDQIKKAFRDAGYSKEEVEDAFKTAHYMGHPALASLPSGATLEGYLYPDSFQKDSNTKAKTIVRQSLDEMNKHLTPDIVAGFKKQNLSTAQAITLASIVIKETDNVEDMSKVAQVLLTRLKLGMRLQSDVTAFYGAAITGQPESVSVESSYNTYLHDGLPPGPVSNASKEALAAVASPAGTDYLFYVTGDNGTTYFSHTKEEHDAAVRQYCHRLCQ